MKAAVADDGAKPLQIVGGRLLLTIVCSWRLLLGIVVSSGMDAAVDDNGRKLATDLNG